MRRSIRLKMEDATAVLKEAHHGSLHPRDESIILFITNVFIIVAAALPGGVMSWWREVFSLTYVKSIVKLF